MDDQEPEVLIRDEAELVQYGYKVAGTVGLLMCCVLNTNDPRAKPHAVDLGIGMQLTNIARDVVVDAKIYYYSYCLYIFFVVHYYLIIYIV